MVPDVRSERVGVKMVSSKSWRRFSGETAFPELLGEVSGVGHAVPLPPVKIPAVIKKFSRFWTRSKAFLRHFQTRRCRAPLRGLQLRKGELTGPSRGSRNT